MAWLNFRSAQFNLSPNLIPLFWSLTVSGSIWVCVLSGRAPVRRVNLQSWTTSAARYNRFLAMFWRTVHCHVRNCIGLHLLPSCGFHNKGFPQVSVHTLFCLVIKALHLKRPYVFLTDNCRRRVVQGTDLSKVRVSRAKCMAWDYESCSLVVLTSLES